MNIPIFRAKKIDSDEWVEGYLIGHYIFKEWIDDFWTSYGETMSNKAEVYNIDVSTLSIHFPDMLDSQGNKIFASLSEDGKGGDICEYKDWDSSYEDEFLNKGICIYEDLKIVFTNRYEVMMEDLEFKYDVKVIGIQE